MLVGICMNSSSKLYIEFTNEHQCVVLTNGQDIYSRYYRQLVPAPRFFVDGFKETNIMHTVAMDFSNVVDPTCN